MPAGATKALGQGGVQGGYREGKALGQGGVQEGYREGTKGVYLSAQMLADGTDQTFFLSS